jgi:hypothetical protein
MSTKVPIAVAHGDGIGPEIMLGPALKQGLEIVKTETLRTYKGAVGYTLSQGQ